MGILNDVLQIKAYEDQKSQREIESVTNGINSLFNFEANQENARRQRQMEDLQMQNIQSQISERSSGVDQFLKLGKVADVAKSTGNRRLYDQVTGQLNNMFGGEQKQVDITEYLAPVVKQSTPTLDSVQQEPSQYEPKELDVFGNPTGYKKVEKSAAQEKRDVEISELEGQAKNLIDLFSSARKEAETVPGIGKQGYSGRIAGAATVAKGKLGYSPTVNVYQDKLKAFATTVAKAAGEQRPTDEDIKRFIDTMPSIAKSDEENNLLMDGLVADLQARGAKALWYEKTNTENKTSDNTTKKGQNTQATPYSEMVAPFVHAASFMTGDLPKQILQSEVNRGEPGAQETMDTMYPEQQTLLGKFVRGGATIGSVVFGLPVKVGMGVYHAATRLAPKWALQSAGGRLAVVSAASALSGAAGAAVSSPKGLDVDQYISNVKTGAILGGAIPVAGAASKKAIDASGKLLADTVLGQKVVDYAKDGNWKDLLNKEYWGENIPKNLKGNISTFFYQAKNNSGSKIGTIMKTKEISQLSTPLKGMQDDIAKLSIDAIEATPKEKETLKKVSNLLLMEGQKDFIEIPKLWGIRKELDSIVQANKVRSPEAVDLLYRIRKTMNEPIRTSSPAIAKMMDDYSFISQVEDQMGGKFEGIVDKQTGEIYSQDISNFLEGLFIGSNKNENISLLKQVAEKGQVPDKFLKDAFDYAAVKAIMKGNSIMQGSLRFLRPAAQGVIQRPTIRAIATGKKISELTGKGTSLLKKFVK
jgi:hypothetical protein